MHKKTSKIIGISLPLEVVEMVEQCAARLDAQTLSAACAKMVGAYLKFAGYPVPDTLFTIKRGQRIDLQDPEARERLMPVWQKNMRRARAAKQDKTGIKLPPKKPLKIHCRIAVEAAGSAGETAAGAA